MKLYKKKTEIFLYFFMKNILGLYAFTDCEKPKAVSLKYKIKDPFNVTGIENKLY